MKFRKPYIIAGPCSAETEDQVFNIANHIKDDIDIFRAGIWKPRTSPNSFEGVGLIGLEWLKKIQFKYKLKVATEVATPQHVESCLSAGIDVLWIGARTTVNPFYVQEIAESLRGVDIPVYVKNPIHPELGLWLGALERLDNVGIKKLSAVHRGFYNYGNSAYRNNPKWEVPIKLRKESPNTPIICDPSHISGNHILIEEISQIAMDIDFDGLMLEVHNSPNLALSDSNQQITPKAFKNILKNLIVSQSKLNDNNVKQELNFLRNQINIFDTELIQLLSKRNDIVREIAYLKKQNQLTVFQIERWFEILKTRTELGTKLKLDNQMVAEIYELIHKYSILLQTRIIR